MRRWLRTMARALLGGLLALTAALLIGPSGGSLPTVDAQPALCPATAGWSVVPTPVDMREYQGRPVANQAYALAEDWRVVGRLYVGSLWGTYVSDDCGQSWKQLWGIPSPAASAVYTVAVATDPSGRVFIADGVQRTLQVSHDGGESWTYLHENNGRPMYAISMRGLSVTSTGRLYVGRSSGQNLQNFDGFGFSDDGGHTWTIIRGERPSRFVADPQQAGTVYAVDSFRRHQLVRSVDSGATFQPWSEVPEPPGALGVSVDGSRFWIAGASQRLWQSRDGGGSWQHITGMPFTDPVQLVTSPHDPRVVFAVAKAALTEAGEIWAYREPPAAPAQVP